MNEEELNPEESSLKDLVADVPAAEAPAPDATAAHAAETTVQAEPVTAAHPSQPGRSLASWLPIAAGGLVIALGSFAIGHFTADDDGDGRHGFRKDFDSAMASHMKDTKHDGDMQSHMSGGGSMQMPDTQGRSEMPSMPGTPGVPSTPGTPDGSSGPTLGEPINPDAPFLGVELAVAEGDDAGALVKTVEPGSAAEKAAVAVGDTITKVGDTAVDGPQAVSAAINSKKAGDTVTLTIVRGTEELKVDVVLGKRVATQQYAIPTSPGGGTITPGNGNLVPITPAPAETSAAPGTSA